MLDEAAVTEPIDHPIRSVLGQGDVHLRMRPMEPRQRFEQGRHRTGNHHANLLVYPIVVGGGMTRLLSAGGDNHSDEIGGLTDVQERCAEPHLGPCPGTETQGGVARPTSPVSSDIPLGSRRTRQTLGAERRAEWWST